MAVRLREEEGKSSGGKNFKVKKRTLLVEGEPTRENVE